MRCTTVPVPLVPVPAVLAGPALAQDGAGLDGSKTEDGHARIDEACLRREGGRVARRAPDEPTHRAPDPACTGMTRSPAAQR